MLAWHVPVTPDAPTARDLLRQELTNPVYHQGPSLVERFVAWLTSLLDGIGVAGVGGVWAALALVAVLLVLAVVALVVSGPLRRDRRTASAQVRLADDTRSADALLADAERSAADGDLAAATLDTFRALVRRSEERALLAPQPGLTAREASAALAVPFPGAGADLATAAESFDALCYGHVQPDVQRYTQVRDLEAAIARTAPTLPAAGAQPASPGAQPAGSHPAGTGAAR